MKENDYTKFKLKSNRELNEIFEKIENIFILWCQKCYKKFLNEIEGDECKNLILSDKFKNKIVGCNGIDFLCNNFHTIKNLEEIISLGIETIGVISCGIGIQFVQSSIKNKRVFSLADSIDYGEKLTAETVYHGISLDEKKCAACGQCYLNITGGICPIVDCAKSLLNGACGGAKNGKCEVDFEKDCAWIKIYERLNLRKEKETEKIFIHNNFKFKPAEKIKMVNLNQNKRRESFYGGVYPLEKKENTENIPISKFPEPEKVILFLSQHTGKPSKLIVNFGQKVKIGEKIAIADGFISSFLHSPISGKIISIEEKFHPIYQKNMPAVIIENDGMNEISEDVKKIENWENLSKEELVNIIYEKGIVGLGGACFPTHVKLTPPKPIDTLIINGCECEPYLNADNRIMIEKTQEILKAIEIVKRILEVKKIFIGIEENKPLAIDRFKNIVDDKSIEIVALKTKYPQGAEKVLINKITGRKVPYGGLPYDIGVIVLNVSTLFSIYKAIYEGFPLIERVITIDAYNSKNVGNFIIKIGTPFGNIIKFVFQDGLNNVKNVVMGGPMMGISIFDFDTAVVKGTTGIIFLPENYIDYKERDCIKCGRCVDVCPMELLPLYYAYFAKNKQWDKFKEYEVSQCIECGCCQYVCSSKINLIKLIKEGKRYAYNKN